MFSLVDCNGLNLDVFVGLFFFVVFLSSGPVVHQRLVNHPIDVCYGTTLLSIMSGTSPLFLHPQVPVMSAAP